MPKMPKGYHPEPGDEFIRLADIGPQHVGRVFEARNQRNGKGILGYLADANAYLLDNVVAIRFQGETLGIFETPDALILLKAEGFTHPDLPEAPRRPTAGLPH